MSNSKDNIKAGSCPVYKKCGGCQLQNLTYAEQLRFKQNNVERLLGKLCKIEPIIGMDNPYHYRNKVQAAFYTDRKGKIISVLTQMLERTLQQPRARTKQMMKTCLSQVICTADNRLLCGLSVRAETPQKRLMKAL